MFRREVGLCVRGLLLSESRIVADFTDDADWKSVTSGDPLRAVFCFAAMPAMELASRRGLSVV